MHTVLILGTARNDGNTHQLAQQLAEQNGWDVVNLNDYRIGFYDYEHSNRADDFIPLMHRLSCDYQTLVFTTPVYWYSMSGVLKVFFDRITDLLKIEKELGRTLRGKNMAVVTSSNGGNLGERFWLPFAHSAEYLGMTFLGGKHFLNGQTDAAQLHAFSRLIEEGTS